MSEKQEKSYMYVNDCISGVHTVLIMGLALRGPPTPPSMSNDVELALGLTRTEIYVTHTGKEGTVRERTKPFTNLYKLYM